MSVGVEDAAASVVGVAVALVSDGVDDAVGVPLFPAGVDDAPGVALLSDGAGKGESDKVGLGAKVAVAPASMMWGVGVDDGTGATGDSAGPVGEALIPSDSL